MRKNGIIFDMDGTLWDSADGVAKAWTQVIAREYTPERIVTVEEVHSVMGLTMDRIADRLFPELPPEKRMPLLDLCCREENDYLRRHGGMLYPRLEETLQKLREKYPLYIVSNCQKGYIEAFLEYYHFGSYFEDIECYGNNGLKKGDNIRLLAQRNSLTEAYYVGDIQGDCDASMEAGVGFIHAAYGFGTVKQEVPVLHSFRELPGLLEQIGF